MVFLEWSFYTGFTVTFVIQINLNVTLNHNVDISVTK